MKKESLCKLVSEVRQDYQIPPYFNDDGLKNYALEGEAILSRLNPGRDIEKDHVYRMLLKNYINYAYHHITNEWQANYATMILEWQLGSEVPE